MFHAATPETLLSERYKITQHVEQGAAHFAAYGYDRDSGMAVFMKARSPDENDHSPAVTANEANRLGSLSHPQVPRLVEADPDPPNGFPFIVMERMPGNPYIEKWFTQHPSHLLAAKLCLSAAEVLEYVHGEGVIHHDVKEANMHMRWSGRVALLDFELATETGHVDDSGLIRGTPTHLAPEQMYGGLPTPQHDIHALGVTLSVLTYGQAPFEGETSREIYRKRITQDINLWTDRRNTPDALRLIMHKATQPDPSRRYASMGEMAEALRLYVENPSAEESGVSIVVPKQVGAKATVKEAPTEPFNFQSELSEAQAA